VKITCFNCAGYGHFSTDCREPRLCFVCQTTDHLGRECPEWNKPVEPAQYLGSAAQGLGFFHVEVCDDLNRRGYLKFLGNCAVLLVEECVISEEEIIDSLKKLFDPSCQWQLKEIEEFRYLVRFPPHKQISATLISDITYFKMKKDGVLVSLKAWDGEIKPYDTLQETWVQISGIPPKWTNWRTLRQVSSSLGKLLEVDQNSLFSSFFSTVRVKVACKNIAKIPGKRLFEMKSGLYLVQFKVELKDGMLEEGDEGGGDNGDPRNEDEDGIEELDHDMEVEKKAATGEKKDPKGSSDLGYKLGVASSGSKKLMDWVSLLQNSEESVRMKSSELAQYSCSRLLREMEAVELESDEERETMCMDDAGLVSFPTEWINKKVEPMEVQGFSDSLYSLPDPKVGTEPEHSDVDGAKLKDNIRKENNTRWGPVLVEKRPSRNPKDGRTMLEKAQERKKMVNLEDPKGMTISFNPFSVLSSYEISKVAKNIGVSLGSSLDEIESSILEV
jgi:hypothetical protein